MKRSNFFAQEAVQNISVENSVNNASLWGRFVEVVKSLCNFGSIDYAEFTVDDRAQDLSVFQSMALSSNVGCSVAAIDSFTAAMTDDQRYIAQDYMQGVSVGAIAHRHGVSKSYVVNTLSSLRGLMN
ncbi:MAG: hypothetical protein K2J74_01285 [Muribaculaceae bacterium]|nr:hypothetical protein [Muribaculaceae bacterium]